MGKVREKELMDSCEALGISRQNVTIVDDPYVAGLMNLLCTSVATIPIHLLFSLYICIQSATGRDGN